MYCEIADLQKRHQNFQCQLANEDDLKLKSFIKEIVLRIVFYIRIEFRRSSVKKFLNSLPPNVKSIGRRKLRKPVLSKTILNFPLCRYSVQKDCEKRVFNVLFLYLRTESMRVSPFFPTAFTTSPEHHL